MKLCLTNKEIDSGRADLDLSSERSIAAYAAKGINVDQSWEEFSTSGVWGVPEELTKHHLKKPRTYTDGGTVISYNAMAFALHYMDLTHLLRIVKDEQERKQITRDLMRFKKLFIEYAEATFGRAQLYWSRGLKERFGIYQLDDSEVGEQLESLVVHLNHLSVDDLQKIVKFRLRPAIMAIVENPEYADDETRSLKVREFIDNQSERVMRFG
ncbi:hypothetical protein FIU95_21765 (plasmid) [Microbulbifer sp. THAF38]|nr:hypothetical protein FIU95_21765 [Microbulbifer sp. THAF38]